MPESYKTLVASLNSAHLRFSLELLSLQQPELLPHAQEVRRETECRLPSCKPAISLALQPCLQGAWDAINRWRPSLCDLVQTSLRGALGCLKAKSTVAGCFASLVGVCKSLSPKLHQQCNSIYALT